MANPLDLRQLRADLETAGRPWVSDENTSMAVMTEDQRRRRLGFTPPPGETSFEEAVARDAAAPRVTRDTILAESTFGALAAFDHRNINGQDYTTPVKNQGGCGSCVAFGTVAALETTYRRSIGNPNFALDLSEAHLFYCLGGEDGRNCSNGWWPEAALDKIRDKGVTLESYYPYAGAQQACQVQSGWESNQARVTGKSKLDGREAIKNWIATRGSVTACFIVYQDFFSYSSGVYRHVSGGEAGGHCVEMIGYNDQQGCWICKNSWGANWGEGGFFRIAYGECQIDTWIGPYGAEGVSLKQWASAAKIAGAWSNDSERNAWVFVTGIGWKKLAADSAPMQQSMLLELLAAKAAQRPVNYFEDQGVIREVYVL